MTVRICRNCDFYCRTAPKFGECRRYPPTPVFGEWLSPNPNISAKVFIAEQRSFFPCVYPNDWCGDWTARDDDSDQQNSEFNDSED